VHRPNWGFEIPRVQMRIMCIMSITGFSELKPLLACECPFGLTRYREPEADHDVILSRGTE
jgi:hypothetical protein